MKPNSLVFEVPGLSQELFIVKHRHALFVSSSLTSLERFRSTIRLILSFFSHNNIVLRNFGAVVLTTTSSTIIVKDVSSFGVFKQTNTADFQRITICDAVGTWNIPTMTEHTLTDSLKEIQSLLLGEAAYWWSRKDTATGQQIANYDVAIHLLVQFVQER